MSTGKPWKLYEAREGHPRQLLGAFDTLRDAVSTFCDITGCKAGTQSFTATVNLEGGRSVPAARFQTDIRTTPYVIELWEDTGADLAT